MCCSRASASKRLNNNLRLVVKLLHCLLALIPVFLRRLIKAGRLLDKIIVPKLLHRSLSPPSHTIPHPRTHTLPPLLLVHYLQALRRGIFRPCVTLENMLFIWSENELSRYLEPDISSSRLSHSLNLLFCFAFYWLLSDNYYANRFP